MTSKLAPKSVWASRWVEKQNMNTKQLQKQKH